MPCHRYYTSSSTSNTSLGSDASNVKPTEAPSTKGVFQLGSVAETDSHHRMLTLIFTCAVCQTRAARQFSHHSYTKGVVIIQCPGCDKYHLIADHLGWFQEGKNIEEFMAKKGDTVRKITDASEITEEIQQYVDQAAHVRAESEERRKAYMSKTQLEEIFSADAESRKEAIEDEERKRL